MSRFPSSTLRPELALTTPGSIRSLSMNGSLWPITRLRSSQKGESPACGLTVSTMVGRPTTCSILRMATMRLVAFMKPLARLERIPARGPLPPPKPPRPWSRPNPPLPRVKWSIRNNINLQQSVVLMAMHYTATNRERLLNNFYLKSKRSIAKATTEGPAAYVIPGDEKRQFDAADLVNLLRRQGCEVHIANESLKT